MEAGDVIRSTLAHIDLSALQHNFRAIQQYLASSAATVSRGVPPGILAVLKANAYGHGSATVGPALEEAGATMLACADIEEAIVLRRAGVRAGILVFGALSLSDLEGLFEYDLVPTISSPSAARAVEAAAAAHGRRLRYHLKIDTGMNRLGFRHDNLRNTIPALLSSTHLDLEAVYTHFATADDGQHPLFEQQRARYRQVLATLFELGARPRLRHAANSAAILRDPDTWFDLVRPGLLLYGIVPPPLQAAIDLRPVMSIRSRVVAVKGLRPSDAVGYGARFTATSPMSIAIIPAGYADGVDLRLGGRGSVLVGGHRAPIIGSISMDMMTVDVTGVAVQPGDEAVILGSQGDQCIHLNDLARQIGTIPYELLCRVGSRIERRYNQSS
jgi:alanine racemase